MGYRVQCLHEATVHGVEQVILVVCFGGQEIVGYPLEFNAQVKDIHIKEMAEFWGRIQARSFDPETMGDAAKLVYRQDNGSNLVATQNLEQACERLKLIKDQIKVLEEQEGQLQSAIQGYMMESSQLVSVDGNVLATWKASKSRKAFSADLFKNAMPEIYDKFIIEQPGSRRFLLK
jgi:predicted phage-related endonuclease